MEWKRLSLIKTARHGMANLERGSEQRASLARLEVASPTRHGVYEHGGSCSMQGQISANTLFIVRTWYKNPVKIVHLESLVCLIQVRPSSTKCKG